MPHPPRHDPGPARGRLQWLLIALVALIVAYPFFTGVVFLNLLLSAVLLAALSAISPERRQFWIALGLGGPYLLAVWIAALGYAHLAMLVVGRGFGILFLGYTATVLLRHVVHARRVDADVLYGAAAAYLLIGLVWALLYGLLEMLQPGSFSRITNADAAIAWGDFLYYSFVTLTTLGYGDLTPLSPRVRSLAVLEAITGVFYVAILVARLVGLHLTHAARPPRSGSVSEAEAP